MSEAEKVLVHAISQQVGAPWKGDDSCPIRLGANRVLHTIASWERAGGMKLSDIAKRTGLSKPRLDAAMLTLKESGLIDRAPAGVSFTAGWSVTAKGKKYLNGR